MKDAYYFSHDANARNDPKIVKLLMHQGWEGYGLYWALVEMLRSEKDYKLERNYSTYAFALRTDESRICAVVEDFELFTVEEGVFYSESLLRRMELREAKSQSARKAAQVRWDKVKPDANAMQTHSERNAIKGKERKGKEKKDNYTVEHPAEARPRVPYKQIIDFLNETVKSDFKPTAQATKRHIKARWNEGFKVEDFKTVILAKADEWLTDDEMCIYLRPQTLFSTKFESYLTAAKRGETMRGKKKWKN